MFRNETCPLVCVRLGDSVARESWRLVTLVCRQVTPLIEEYPQRRALFLALGGSERLLLGNSVPAASLVTPETAKTLGPPEDLWPWLRESLIRRLSSAGLRGDMPMVGIGATRTLAWLAALPRLPHAAMRVALPGERQTFLAGLPVAALLETPDAAEIASLARRQEIVAALEESGIRTLGQLHRLQADALARRFGREGERLAILAAGGDLRPLHPRVAEPWLGARLVFEPSVIAEQLTVALGPLAEKLALALAQRELAAGKIAVALESEKSKRLRVERWLAHPLGTTRALLEAAERLLVGLLAHVPAAPLATAMNVVDALPDVELPAAGERYVTLRLRVGGLHPTTAEQRRLWAGEQRQAGAERVERLATAIRALQGGKHAEALLRADLCEPDATLPEERYRLTPRTPQAHMP